MTLNVSWTELKSAAEPDLKSQVFSLITEAGHRLRTHQGDDPEILALVPRLWDLVDARQELGSYKELLSAFSRSCGLWNYVDSASADDRDAVVAASVTAPELDGVVFHREQIAALNILLGGRNLILSAPTSFGKSLLVDALIATHRFHRLAIVVPTIALLDETRRRLDRRFRERYAIVMYADEPAPEGNVIFLGTQERLINRRDIGHLDLLVVDEFYKLDPHRDDERSVTLNAAVYRLLKDSSQFFFLGPNIEHVRVSGEGRWRFEFLRTRFSTVAVNTFDLRGEQDQAGRLIEEATATANLPALVFASSPDRANALAQQFVSSAKVGNGGNLADWIDYNYGEGWEASDAIRAGVGVHHGRTPRALASRLVQEFNSGNVPVLICTSTLIEGVNTAAKSVLIYDKQINRKDYDFFTYSNIRGRAGRLGKHLVGNVYLFHGEPEQTETAVSAPLFDDLNEAPDDMLIYLDEDDRGPVADDRLEVLREQIDLTGDDLRKAATIGLDKAIAVRRLIVDRYSADYRMDWAGFANYDNLVAICEIVDAIDGVRSVGMGSPRQMALYISELRRSESMRRFFTWHMGGTAPQYREGVFRFLRACDYGLPQMVAVIEVFARRAFPGIDYSLLEAGLPNYFRSPILKHLEERGVPVQISERFINDNDTLGTLSARLLSYAAGDSPLMSPIERDWVISSLGA